MKLKSNTTTSQAKSTHGMTIKSYAPPPPQSNQNLNTSMNNNSQNQQQEALSNAKTGQITKPAHISLTPIHAFGTNFSLNIQDSLYFYEEDQQQKLLYPVGRHIGIRECETSQMQFIFIGDNVERITAMQMTPNKRFLATAEKIIGDPFAYISFYDMVSRQLKHRILLKPYGLSGAAGGAAGGVATGAPVTAAGSQDQQSSSISQQQPTQQQQQQQQQQHPHNTSSQPSMLLQQSFDQAQPSQFQQFLGVGANPGASATSIQQGSTGIQQTTMQAFDIISFSFSSDSKFVACLGSDGTAVLWDWYNKNKQLGSTSLGSSGVTRITIDPKDNHSICTSGYQHFKIWRVQENQFKALPPIAGLPSSQVFSDHVWADEDRIIATTDIGQVFIIQGNQLRQHINRAFQESDPVPITAVRSFSRGFFLGSDQGAMSLWIHSDQSASSLHKDLYQFTRKWLPGRKRNCKVNCLSVSPGEESLAVAFNDNDLGLASIPFILQGGLGASQSPQNSKINNFEPQRGQGSNEKQIPFEFLCSGFHTSNISGLDVSMQRPLLASSSKQDSTIRIWNYSTLRCELARQFYVVEDLAVRESTRPLLSLALHPNGYYLAAGFLDRIRFFHLLHNELRVYRELPLGGCNVLKFSNNGHIFIAAQMKFIRVYLSFTLEHIISLSGPHSRITSLSFSSRDAYLSASTLDGTVFVWGCSNWQQQTQSYKHSVQDTTFTSSCSVDDERPSVISTGATVSSKQGILVQTGQNGKEVKKIYMPHTRYTQCLIMNSSNYSSTRSQFLSSSPDRFGMSQRTLALPSASTQHGSVSHPNRRQIIQSLICGTQHGKIEIFGLPLSQVHENQFDQKCLDSISVHCGQINKLVMSPDGKYVFSAGFDGSIFIHAVKEIWDDGTVIEIGQTIGKQSTAQLIDNNKKMMSKHHHHHHHHHHHSSLISSAAGGGGGGGSEELHQKKVMDQGLADVLLVKRHDLYKFQKRHQDLLEKKAGLDREIEYQRNLNRQIEQQKLKNEKQALNIELKKAQQRYQNLLRQKQLQDDQNLANGQRLQQKHLSQIRQLQSRYDKKIAIETQNILKLEQQKLQKKQEYQNRILKLQSVNQLTADGLRNQFAKNLSSVKSQCYQTKQTAENLKNVYEERLMQQEEEHQNEISDLKLSHIQLVEKLKKQLSDLQEKNQQKKTKRKQIQAAKDQLQRNKNKNLYMRSDLEQKIEQKTRQISVLEKDIEQALDNLKKKNNKLYEYRFKIKDLQKSKHVLTFRTTQMKESLEPKEAQIQKLSEQLLVLEGEFEKQLKNMNDLVGNLNQLENQIIQLNRDLQKQEKFTLEREQTIFNFRRDVFITVAMKEEKEFIKDLKKLNEVYVLASQFEQQERAKREQQSIQEMDRQLRQMEKSITTLKVNAVKHDQRTRVDLKKRTTQNAQLIHDLNELLVKKKRLLVQRGEIKAKLALQEKRKVNKEANFIQEDELQASMAQQSKDDSQRRSYMKKQIDQSSYLPIVKNVYDSGKIQKTSGNQVGNASAGSLLMAGSQQQQQLQQQQMISNQGKRRIQDLTAHLDKNNEQIMYQKLQIKRLQEQINQFSSGFGTSNEQAQMIFQDIVDEMIADPVFQSGQSPQQGFARNKMRVPTTMQGKTGAALMSKVGSSFLPKVPSKSNF